MKYIEKRPWEDFLLYMINQHISWKNWSKSGQQLSYQYHQKRSESWTFVSGSGIVTLDNKKLEVNEGDTVLIPIKSKHRVANNQDNVLVFIEVQTGSYFGEDDIVRISDDYNRK